MANIFVVDDDALLSDIYQKKLTDGGHKAEVVADRDVVATLKNKKPDLILLDILMPVNGLDILREIKGDPETSQIPVLLLTNVAEEASIERGLKYGADGYLLKSEMTPDQLLERVNASLEKNAPPTP